jgi:hypothetical protein
MPGTQTVTKALLLITARLRNEISISKAAQNRGLFYCTKFAAHSGVESVARQSQLSPKVDL